MIYMHKNGPQFNSLIVQRKPSANIFKVVNLGVCTSALRMYLKNLYCDLKMSVSRI
jgi:hypothetical protein